MINEISVKLKQEFNKNWKVLTEGENYNIPETIEDLKTLGIFPYFKIQNLWVFPKDHAHKRIRHLISLIQEIVGDELFSRETVSEAVRDEIKLYFNSKEKSSNEWYLTNILKVVSSKSKKRIVVREINGLQLKDFKQIDGSNWKLLYFDENEINNVVNNESGDQEWKSHLKGFLNKKFKDKVVLVIETEGDLKKAKKKANHIATYLINTLRYFICIHASNTGKAHKVGIYPDTPNQVGWMNAFSVDLQDKSTTISGSGGHFRHKYPLTKENLEAIKKDWFAEKLWSLVNKKDLNDIESSIVSSINWLGDAQQEDDLNSAYVKYWISIEALITGHKKGDTSVRLKNSIPAIISQISAKVPSKSQVDKAYELRGKVVHCGNKEVVSMNDLNKICLWATQCLSMCIYLSSMNYKSRDQIENKIESSFNRKS